VKEKRLNEIKGIFFIAAGLIILASLISFDTHDVSFHTYPANNPPHNLVRMFGAYLSAALVFSIGRIPSFIIPFFVLWIGVSFFRQNPPYWSFYRGMGFLILIISACALVGLFYLRTETLSFYRGGGLGYLISRVVVKYFGEFGGYIVFLSLFLLSFALVTEILVSTLLLKCCKGLGSFDFLVKALPVLELKRGEKRRPGPKKQTRRDFPEDREKLKINGTEGSEEDDAVAREEKLSAKVAAMLKPKIKIKEPAVEEEKTKIKPPVLKIGNYQLPTFDLLESPPPLEARQIKEDLAGNARILESTLDDFGIAVKVTDIERGPIITRYELEPAPGVKLNRIVSLEDDIALAMKAQSVRILAPIPGKARVGIEVPNSQSSLVFLKDIFVSKEFQSAESKLTMALGKDISGKPVIADLGQMPHLLIAGTTGSGKTVCVNSLILSLLFKATPNELKMVMVDPKMVELAPFNGLPHLLCPVVTDSKKAAVALNWVLNEMEHRYQMLAEVGARNIEGYNQKKDKEKEIMPYMVVIVDEFADLMMVAREQIETAVTRLAQLSRAVGIHLILATQRPSVDVITGVIKANLPARISFKVASKVDSRTVLDMNGADKLLGRGDMLFLKPQEAKVVRAQGALVKDKEIEKVVEFVKAQAAPVYDEEVLKGQQKTALTNGERDDLYDEAVKVVMETNQASVSILQRRLRLGYTRAARIVDMMEEDGFVGPYEGSKPRKIIVDREEWLQKELAKNKS